MSDQTRELLVSSGVERLQLRVRQALDRGRPMAQVEREITSAGADAAERWQLLVYARHYARGRRYVGRRKNPPRAERHDTADWAKRG